MKNIFIALALFCAVMMVSRTDSHADEPVAHEASAADDPAAAPAVEAPRHHRRAFAEPSFDCSEAKTKIEKLICSDGDLVQLDNDLAHMVYMVKVRYNDQHLERFNKEQRTWLESRDKACNLDTDDIDKQVECVASVYEKRIKQISEQLREQLTQCGIPTNGISAAYHKCINAHQDNTSWAMCGSKEIERQESSLDKAWEKISKIMKKRLPPDGGEWFASLKTEQENWKKWEESACEYYQYDFGREGAVLSYPSCHARIIADRVIQLQGFADELTYH